MWDPVLTPPKINVIPRGVSVRVRLRKHERAAVASSPETAEKSKRTKRVVGWEDASVPVSLPPLLPPLPTSAKDEAEDAPSTAGPPTSPPQKSVGRVGGW